ncbi:MAG TPA: DUF1223 domain-containing protein [Stellaceae bacterium]|nr:DUF1223 domain-containing protein [Stellaceae bacterium]
MAGIASSAAVARDDGPPVVVELFTSQGCSSCPPADNFLGELAQRSDVLALAFHVDYWNYIGWVDPFASKLATQRQRDYSQRLALRYVYTPQMVINGAAEGVGAEPDTIIPLIEAAAADRAPRAVTTLARTEDGHLTVHIDAGSSPEPALIWLVGFDREHTTSVLRGENEGRTLKEYQVVRSFREIGTWNGAAVDLDIAGNAASGDGSVAVLVQLHGTGRIIGAAALKPPTS